MSSRSGTKPRRRSSATQYSATDDQRDRNNQSGSHDDNDAQSNDSEQDEDPTGDKPATPLPKMQLFILCGKSRKELPQSLESIFHRQVRIEWAR